MSNPSKSEIAAVSGMQKGNMTPFAALLAELLSEPVPNITIHRMVLNELWKLLAGSPDDTDYRLERRRHPDLRPGQSQAEWLAQQGQEQATAFKLVMNGKLTKGMSDSADMKTMTETGFSRATVTNHWRNQKRYIHMCLQTGVLKEEDLPDPIDWSRFDKSK